MPIANSGIVDMDKTIEKLEERLKLEVLCYHRSQESMDYVLQELEWLYKQPKKTKRDNE